MEDTTEKPSGAGGVTTSAACDVVVQLTDGNVETVQLNATVSFDKDVKSRLDKAASVLKADKDIAMHGIEVRYDCNSITAFDCGDEHKQLSVSRLRVERTYYSGDPEISVMLDVSHSARSAIPALAGYVDPTDAPESFTYLVKYSK